MAKGIYVVDSRKLSGAFSAVEVFFHGICDSSTSGLTSLLENILTYKIGEVNFIKVAKIEMYFVTLKSSGHQSLLNICTFFLLSYSRFLFEMLFTSEPLTFYAKSLCTRK